MYFCVYEKARDNSCWFYTRTLAYIDLHCGVELYKLKSEITHIEGLFEQYKLDNLGYTYKMEIKNYDPSDTDRTHCI